jgi:hypothetical protein
MATRFAAGNRALAICDRCGLQYKLKQLKNSTSNNNLTNLLVCPECYEESHPQNSLGKYVVVDAQALRNPRPDAAELIASRDIQWGWRPVGLNNPLGITGLSNDLEAIISIGSVTVTTT